MGRSTPPPPLIVNTRRDNTGVSTELRPIIHTVVSHLTEVVRPWHFFVANPGQQMGSYSQDQSNFGPSAAAAAAAAAAAGGKGSGGVGYGQSQASTSQPQQQQQHNYGASGAPGGYSQQAAATGGGGGGGGGVSGVQGGAQGRGSTRYHPY